MRIVLALVAMTVLLGCPARSRSGPTAECVRTGEQCELRDGLLGVCSPTTTATCKREPCLACMPQH